MMARGLVSQGASGRRQGLFVLLLASGACAHRTPGPAEIATSFAAAVDRRDYAGAYALTSERYRHQVSLAAFRAEVDAQGPGAPPLAQRMASATTPPVRFDLELGLGEKLVMVQEGGAFRLDAPPLAPFPQDSPRAALRSFIRAAEQRRFDVLLRLAPGRYRGRLTEAQLRAVWEGEKKAQNDKMLSELRASITAPIVELGDEAHMPYGEREVRFVREDGIWKIDDPD
jgi:hypothetical protein